MLPLSKKFLKFGEMKNMKDRINLSLLQFGAWTAFFGISADYTQRLTFNNPYWIGGVAKLVILVICTSWIGYINGKDK